MKRGDRVTGRKFVFDRWYETTGRIEILQPRGATIRDKNTGNLDWYAYDEITLMSDSAATVRPSDPSPRPAGNAAILGIGGIGIFTENEMPVIPSARAIEREMRMQRGELPNTEQCDGCGLWFPRIQMMSASLGRACHDCYDRMSG